MWSLYLQLMMKWERATKFRLRKVKLLPGGKKVWNRKGPACQHRVTELPQQFKNWKSEKKKKKKSESLSFNSENREKPQADQRQSSKLVSHIQNKDCNSRLPMGCQD